MRVLVECCLQEQVYNKYYSVLATRLCSHDNNHKATLKVLLFLNLDLCCPIGSIHMEKKHNTTKCARGDVCLVLKSPHKPMFWTIYIRTLRHPPLTSWFQRMSSTLAFVSCGIKASHQPKYGIRCNYVTMGLEVLGLCSLKLRKKRTLVLDIGVSLFILPIISCSFPTPVWGSRTCNVEVI